MPCGRVVAMRQGRCMRCMHIRIEAPQTCECVTVWRDSYVMHDFGGRHARYLGLSCRNASDFGSDEMWSNALSEKSVGFHGSASTYTMHSAVPCQWAPWLCVRAVEIEHADFMLRARVRMQFTFAPASAAHWLTYIFDQTRYFRMHSFHLRFSTVHRICMRNSPQPLTLARSLLTYVMVYNHMCSECVRINSLHDSQFDAHVRDIAVQ